MEQSKPSQVEIAEALGVKKSYVTKKKKEGMPVDSIEAARTWLENNRKRAAPSKATPVEYDDALFRDLTGYSTTIEVNKQTQRDLREALKHKEISKEDYEDQMEDLKTELADLYRKRAEKLHSVLKLDVLMDAKLNNDTSMEGRMRRAEEVERLMFRYITYYAMTGDIGMVPNAQRNFTNASKDRTTFQRDMVKYQEMVKDLVDYNKVVLMISYLLGPLQSRMTELSLTLAKLLDQDNPERLLPIIQEPIDKTLAQIREDFGKWKKT